MEDNKIYFTPGDVVTLRQEIPNKPTMIVHRIEKTIIRGKGDDNTLKGICCRWFTTSGSMCEETFSTKDLIKL